MKIRLDEKRNKITEFRSIVVKNLLILFHEMSHFYECLAVDPQFNCRITAV